MACRGGDFWQDAWAFCGALIPSLHLWTTYKPEIHPAQYLELLSNPYFLLASGWNENELSAWLKNFADPWDGWFSLGIPWNQADVNLAKWVTESNSWPVASLSLLFLSVAAHISSEWLAREKVQWSIFWFWCLLLPWQGEQSVFLTTQLIWMFVITSMLCCFDFSALPILEDDVSWCKCMHILYLFICKSNNDEKCIFCFSVCVISKCLHLI